jgi:hypothetical protein
MKTMAQPDWVGGEEVCMIGDLQNRSVATCNEKKLDMLVVNLGMLLLRGPGGISRVTIMILVHKAFRLHQLSSFVN